MVASSADPLLIRSPAVCKNTYREAGMYPSELSYQGKLDQGSRVGAGPERHHPAQPQAFDGGGVIERPKTGRAHKIAIEYFCRYGNLTIHVSPV